MSDWKERSINRRDTRQTKVPDIRPPSGSKKNTKRWCRGKFGVEHRPICVSYSEFKNIPATDWSKDWKLLICSECKKTLDYWWPMESLRLGIPRYDATPPDWVK